VNPFGEEETGPEIEAWTPCLAPAKGRWPGGGRGAEAGKLYCDRPVEFSVYIYDECQLIQLAQSEWELR